MKRIITLLLILTLLALTMVGCGKHVHIDPNQVPLSGSPDDYKEVEAYYYVNNTGESSKYISYDQCEEIGVGTVKFDKSISKLTVRNDPVNIGKNLGTVPNYTSLVSDNEYIQWKTIYRSNGVYRVIGEVMEWQGDEDSLAEFFNSLFGSLESDYESDFESDAEPAGEFEEARTDFESVAEMLDCNLEAGMNVSTRGYYAADDGGAGTYTISEEGRAVSEQLGNGLYANLEFEDSINIRQVGARGNDEDDDSASLEKALYSGASIVIIPEGTYNLSNRNIVIPKDVKISGIEASVSTLHNVNFTAPEGISLSNLTCEGAAVRQLRAPGMRMEQTVMIDATPAGAQSLSYENCIFRKVGCVSYAYANQQGYFTNDTVNNCVFTEIERAPIFHCCNSENSYYTNNVFTELGNDSIIEGILTGIWIGDCSNNTTAKAEYLRIEGNTFRNMYTADNFDPNSKHSLAANFIAIQATKADVIGNTFENLLGYGQDREAVYTKVNDLTIDNNTIINGGTGEGYICNKSAVKGDINATITNNTIQGEFGSGIRLYGPGVIQDNKIEIEHCENAITTTAKGGQYVEYPVEIVGNEIRCGEEGDYEMEGATISGYNSGKLINIVGTIGDTNVSGNTIEAGEEYSSYVSIGNVRGHITIEDNTIDTSGNNGSPVLIYNSANSPVTAEQEITINRNEMYLNGGQKGVNMSLNQQATSRNIEFDNNTFTFSNTGVISYPLSMYAKGSNDDTLSVEGNTANSVKKKTYIKYTTETLENNDEGFAVFSKSK